MTSNQHRWWSAANWWTFWCAGAGVVGTPAAEMAAETETWERFLARLGSVLESTPPASRRPLSVFFASSAGGIYAGSSAVRLTELSPTHPLSPYGEEKLRQERALVQWAASHIEVSTLVARISNLYGPGQKSSKPQGHSPRFARR